MGSGESRFNVPLTVGGGGEGGAKPQLAQCPSTNHIFLTERRTEAESNRGPSAY